jgi:hypothetical protein
LGTVGRTCRSFLLRTLSLREAGFLHLFRSHCGRYWAIVILISFC